MGAYTGDISVNSSSSSAVGDYAGINLGVSKGAGGAFDNSGFFADEAGASITGTISKQAIYAAVAVLGFLAVAFVASKKAGK